MNPMSDLSARERLRLTLTPALMAQTATRGQWRMAPHLALIDDAVHKLVTRKIKERVLVVRMPPRHGKSEYVSHWTATWHKANFPHLNVLLASYEANFAATWGRRARDRFIEVVEMAPDCFDAGISPDRQAASDWGTTAGGYMATAGVGGPFTGKGFHLGICDDLIKNAEEAQSEVYRRKTWEWFTSTFWTRREPEGVLVVIGTPWHRDDYLARLRNWEEPIHEICLPAICDNENDPLGREVGQALWPARYDENELAKIERAQGPYYWSALYQQKPSQHDLAEWPQEYFGEHLWYDDEPPDDIECCTIAVDSSMGKTDKSDFSAFMVVRMDSRGVYWIDATIERCDVSRIAGTAIRLCLENNPHGIGFETNSFQELIADEFLRQCHYAGLEVLQYGINNTANKIVRIRTLGPLLCNRRIRIKRNQGGIELVNQLQDFPIAEHDDGPDALEMGIRLTTQLMGDRRIGVASHGSY